MGEYNLKETPLLDAIVDINDRVIPSNRRFLEPVIEDNQSEVSKHVSHYRNWDDGSPIVSSLGIIVGGKDIALFKYREGYYYSPNIKVGEYEVRSNITIGSKDTIVDVALNFRNKQYWKNDKIYKKIDEITSEVIKFSKNTPLTIHLSDKFISFKNTEKIDKAVLKYKAVQDRILTEVVISVIIDSSGIRCNLEGSYGNFYNLEYIGFKELIERVINTDT